MTRRRLMVSRLRLLVAAARDLSGGGGADAGLGALGTLGARRSSARLVLALPLPAAQRHSRRHDDHSADDQEDHRDDPDAAAGGPIVRSDRNDRVRRRLLLLPRPLLRLARA